MSEKTSAEEVNARFKELASGYQPKLPPKLAQLLPFKKQIQDLRARNAAYDDIRLLLANVNVSVSLDTIHRFCRNVIGQPVVHAYKSRTKKNPLAKNLPNPSPAEKNGVALPPQPEAHERYDGPWSKKKNVPRIANLKNL